MWATIRGVEGYAGEGGVEGGALDAARLGERPQPVDKGAEGDIGLSRRLGRGPFRRCRCSGLFRHRPCCSLSRRRGFGRRDGDDQRGGESGGRGEAAPDGRSEARHGHDPRWSARG